MVVSNMHATSDLATAGELRTVMQGRIVLRGDNDYDSMRQVWNGALRRQPALFAICEASADVQAAVRSARAHGLPLSVRGGGHDFAGRALCHDNFRGAATRVPLEATAFGLRKENFIVEILAMWEPAAGEDGHADRQRARTVSDNLAPYALPGGYANMLGLDEHEQTAHAYGANIHRLQEIKRRFDADSVFMSAISPPFERAV